MKDRFSIGQMSRIHDIPIRTLRYYDKIGLFNPAEVDSGSGYRFYSSEQFEELSLIKYLRFMNISIKEIKNHLESRDIDVFIKILEEQRDSTIKKIEELNIIRKKFEKRIEEVSSYKKKENLGEIIIENVPKRYVYKLEEGLNSNFDIEIKMRELENKVKIAPSLIIGNVGLTMSKENIINGEYNKYNSIFILTEIDKEKSDKNMTIITDGEYVRVKYNGDRRENYKYYLKIRDFLNEKGYKISGDSLERVVIDNFISKRNEDLITEIEIPVKRI